MFQAEVNSRPGERYVAVRVAGDVDTGTRTALAEALERALAVGSASVVVDLSAVQFFAAAGVHCVERAVDTIEARGGAAHLVCPRPGAAWRVVSLLGLHRQWRVHQDVAHAIARCASPHEHAEAAARIPRTRIPTGDELPHSTVVREPSQS